MQQPMTRVTSSSTSAGRRDVTRSIQIFRVFVSSWLHLCHVQAPAGKGVHIDRVSIRVEGDGAVLIGAEDRRADVAIPLQDLWRGVAEMVRSADAEHRDLRLERLQEFRAARRQAAVMRLDSGWN